MTNCETETELVENPQTIQQEFIIKQYHFNDLISNSTFYNSFEMLNTRKSKPNYSLKSSENDIYNFIIDSTRIKEVIKGNYTSYTLYIKRPFETAEYFENLVLEKKESEIIKAYIIKYTPSSQIELFEEHHTFSFEATSQVYPLSLDNLNLASKSTSDCMPIAQTWCSWQYDHVADSSCYEANDGRLFTKFVEDDNCTETGTPGTSGGGATPKGGDSDPILTSPVDPDGNPVEFPNVTSQINEELSLNSPYSVDMTHVLDSIALPKNDSILIANEKFLCLFSKLTTSNTYKNLFENIFGGSQDVLNVQFKVTKDLKNSKTERVNGLCTPLPSNRRDKTTKEVTRLDILIEIDESLLTTNSNFNATKTILHESIHAYLFLKKYNCNSTVPFGEFNNEDLCQTINSYYNDFDCSGTQGQHEFMFDNMLPTFQTIFNEIGKLNFMTQGNINGLSDNYDLHSLHNPTQPNGLNIPNSHIFNWDEFYLYNTLPGLHNTSSFENEIENNLEKKELYKAYRSLGKTYLKKECN